MRLTDGLLAPLEIALNRYLAEDPEVLARLADYDDQVLALQLRELGFTTYLRAHAQGFQVLGDWPGPRATVITSLPVLGRMLVSEDKGRSLVLEGDIRIEGDNEFAQALMEILRDIDFDPEEVLSRYIGDVPAHRVGQLMRGLFSRGRDQAESLGRETVRFLRDDQRDLVAREETRDWLDAVDRLRTDVERVEARMNRLLDRAGVKS